MQNRTPRTLWTLLRLALPLLAVPLMVPIAQAGSLDAQLQHLRGFREGRLPAHAPFAPASARESHVRVYLVFREPPSPEILHSLEAQGVELQRQPGPRPGDPPVLAHVGTVYGARVPWSILPGLEQNPHLRQIDAVERRLRLPTLDLSTPEIDWSDNRFMPQAGTDGLSGRGVIVADFDTSMDPTHPALFKPDGGSHAWIDVNKNGVFSPGSDTVDLNGDGIGQVSEILQVLEGYLFSRSFGPQVDGALDADRDWVFADQNGNGSWDAGADAGFTETTPAYGEPIFLVEDANGDNTLSPGEKLIRLQTSKILAARDGNSGATIHRRGQNLLSMVEDEFPHGTSVAGIVAGDRHGRTLAGVAPDAELISVRYDAAGIDLVSMMSWAKSEGADVMLWEFGEWIGEYLDGSSALETAISTEAASGIPQICPAGNIGQEPKHGRLRVAPGETGQAVLNIDPTLPPPNVIYLTALWRQQNPVLAFKVAFPDSSGGYGSNAVTVQAGQTVSDGQGHYVSAVASKSSRNTNMLDLVLWKQSGSESVRVDYGTTQIQVVNTGSSTATLHLYLGDDLYGWSGGPRWNTSGAGAVYDPSYSVSSPGTADTCITVGSYAIRTQATVGQLSTFSGRGPRIDEQSIIDLAAPGNYDVYSPTSTDATYFNQEISASVSYAPGGYWQFGGTSAASAHVAGVVALMKQLDPAAGHADIEAALKAGALADGYTGVVPNDDWGMGKLRVGDALRILDEKAPTFLVAVQRHPVMKGYLQVTVVASERLAGPPQLTGSQTYPAPAASVNDLYVSAIPAPSSGSISLTVTGVDLAGNQGSSTATHTFAGE